MTGVEFCRLWRDHQWALSGFGVLYFLVLMTAGSLVNGDGSLMLRLLGVLACFAVFLIPFKRWSRPKIRAMRAETRS